MRKINVKVEKINKEAQLPCYMSKHASGMDLCACLDKKVKLKHMEVALIPTGIRMSIPAGYEIQVRPRSGLAFKYGISVLNTPGTIDADYRGEIKVILINFGKKVFVVNPNDRIAQLVLAKVERAEIKTVKSLDETKRGSGGFGHTGV